MAQGAHKFLERAGREGLALAAAPLYTGAVMRGANTYIRGVCAVAALMGWLGGCSNEEARRGRAAANAFAIREARKAQAILAETGRCPETLAGWTPSPRFQEGLVTEAGAGQTRYQLQWVCINDEFSIDVKYSLDSGTAVMGRMTGPLELSHGHFTAPSTIWVSATDDPDEVAARVAGR